MFRFLLLLFIAIPVLEIYLLIEIGSVIGAIPTILLVVFTAFLGAFLIRFQGLSTIMRAQTSLAHGEIPTVAMLEGVVLLICGALLLTPGFFTDTLGFLALVPPLRQAMILKILEKGIIVTQGPAHGPGPRNSRPQDPHTIEGEYKREE